MLANARSSSRREADDHVGREVEVVERLDASAELPDRVAASHRAQHVVVARLQRDVEVPRDDGGLAHRRDQVGGDVVHLDRREPQPLEAVDRSRRPDQPRERQPGLAIAEAAEIDAGEHDLLVALRRSPPDLVEDGGRRPAAGGTTDERDHAERARERAAVLDPDEGADPVEPVVGLDAADRTDIGGDGVGELLAPTGDHPDVVGQAGERLRSERLAAQPVTIDAGVGPRGLRRRLAGLRDRLVRDAARVDDGDVSGTGRLAVTVREQALPDRLLVGERHLAPEEPRRERGHVAGM